MRRFGYYALTLLSALCLSVQFGACGVEPSAELRGQWVQVSAPAATPPARMNQSMVHRPKSDDFLLFGGVYLDQPGSPVSASTLLGDTWSYAPATNEWREIAPAGVSPSARTGQQMVFCPDRDVALLFGGQDASLASLDDLWELDPELQQWTDLRPHGQRPSGRVEAAMGYDETSHTVLLFGGSTSSSLGDEATLLDDLWRYDATSNTWEELHLDGRRPGPRRWASLAYDSVSHKMFLFGGYARVTSDSPWQPTGELWAYDPASNRWEEVTPAGDDSPPSGVLIYEPGIAKLLVFSAEESEDGALVSWVWSYDPINNQGMEVPSANSAPPAWDGQSVTCSSGTQGVFIYGGCNAFELAAGRAREVIYSKDFWIWTAETG